uniref:Uncharacterized protein n=1 Tax=Oryza glumipatula TaxID=40148 RepID=A0A0D9YHG9_9ORYZ
MTAIESHPRTRPDRIYDGRRWLWSRAEVVIGGGAAAAAARAGLQWRWRR